VAVVRYTLKNRKPDQVIAIETTRLKVDENGMCDSDYMNNYKRLAVNRLFVWNSALNNDDNISTSKKVVDATSRFNQKEWEALHPKLPRPVQKQILDILFP
jgi:hypothetical protein